MGLGDLKMQQKQVLFWIQFENKHQFAKSAKSEMFFVNYTHNKIKQTKDLI